MQCPCCGAAALVQDTRDITTADGLTVKAVTADFCPACGEGILDRIEGDRYAKALADVRRNG